VTDLNHEALRYQLRIHGVEHHERTDADGVTFYVICDDLPAALVEQVGACGFDIVLRRVYLHGDPRCIIAPDAAVGGDD